MDNQALSVSKSITEYLQHNERLHANQQSQQIENSKLLLELQRKLEELDRKNQELAEQNKDLRDELEAIKKQQVEMNRDVITNKSDFDRMNKEVEECKTWSKLMGALTHGVSSLNDFRVQVNDQINILQVSNEKINKRLESQTAQITSFGNVASRAMDAVSSISRNQISSSRIPYRSPSTSSFFNTNFHNNQHRVHTPTQPSRIKSSHQDQTGYHHHNHLHQQLYQNNISEDDYMGSLNVDDGLSELEEAASDVIQGVTSLNELHRSFGKSSQCSDSPYQ